MQPRGRGVAYCCLALWSSEQVDRHLLPVWLWVSLWFADSSPLERAPYACMGVPGCWWSGVSGLGGPGKPGLPTTHCEQSGSSRVLGAALPPHLGKGLGPFGSVSLSVSVMCLSPSLLCPMHLALLPLHTSSAIPTLEGVCCMGWGLGA